MINSKGICAICGKEFTKNVAHQAYCSAECRREYENQKKRDKRKKNLVSLLFKCVVCGKEFTPRHRAQKCCSEECIRQNHIEYNRKYRKVHTHESSCHKKPKRRKNTSPSSSVKKSRLPKSNRQGEEKIVKKHQLLQAVIKAQNGPANELWKESQTWTREQREFAKERYKKRYLSGNFL